VAPIGWRLCCSTRLITTLRWRTLRIAVAAHGGAIRPLPAIDAEIERLKRGTGMVDYKRMLAFCRRPVGTPCRH
jgi:hypothetical protein